MQNQSYQVKIQQYQPTNQPTYELELSLRVWNVIKTTKITWGEKSNRKLQGKLQNYAVQVVEVEKKRKYFSFFRLALLLSSSQNIRWTATQRYKWEYSGEKLLKAGQTKITLLNETSWITKKISPKKKLSIISGKTNVSTKILLTEKIFTQTIIDYWPYAPLVISGHSTLATLLSLLLKVDISTVNIV